MRVDDATFVQIAVEGILVSGACIVGNLDSSGLTSRIVVDIEVGRLVKAMEDWAY